MTHHSDTTNLPALIDRACSRLAQARTSAEVLEAKNIAEAALHYAKLTGAANETHADCLRMIVRAEMRMATEIDRGQARGEVAKKHDNQYTVDVRDSDNHLVTLETLGVDRRRVAEWRDARDAGEQIVEQAIESALAEGRAPTKADVTRAVRQGKDPKPTRERVWSWDDARDRIDQFVNAELARAPHEGRFLIGGYLRQQAAYLLAKGCSARRSSPEASASAVRERVRAADTV